jgi:Cysteine rich repeat
MSQQTSSSSMIAGAVTIVALGLVWATVAGNFPSQEELFSTVPPAEARQVVRPLPSLSVPPALDLTIPTSPPLPSDAAIASPGDDRPHDANVDIPVVSQLDSRPLQAARLKCEADVEQLCPDSPDGSTRTRCLQQRAKQLPPLCQNQLKEQFVKWKEDRSRVMAACDEDVRRFCRAMKPGGGQIFQCLQSHGQEVSDRCYQTLPKGTFFFK